jgi:protein TonB
MPQFPGGEAALMKYLKSHINYPPKAAKNNIEGNVIVQFVVKKDGSIGEVKVVHSLEKDLDKEAVRVVKSLPKFTPGRHDGQAVSVWYTLPVSFKLK